MSSATHRALARVLATASSLSAPLSSTPASRVGVVRWARWRWRSWWSIIRVLPAAGKVAIAALALNLVIGVLPLGFAIGTSVAIERVAAAGSTLGVGSRWGGVLIAVVLAVAPAGSVLALVGENGAGKSTLVKLLCDMYRPTSGRILVDGQDLAGMAPQEWRSRVTALFQDFHHTELTLGESIGHGDIARVGDMEAIGAAAARARADQVVRRVPGGLSGYVGHSYQNGAELSGGEWQTVGLARTLLREDPLLLILDEPAAALDPSAEHDLFEQYATSAGRAGQRYGGITVLISHRFSTVAMADSIAVLQGGRLAEHGTHHELMAGGSLYAELYALQARAYS